MQRIPQAAAYPGLEGVNSDFRGPGVPQAPGIPRAWNPKFAREHDPALPRLWHFGSGLDLVQT